MEIRPAWQNSAFIIELSNGTQWNSWQNDVIIEAKRIPVFANIEENQEKMLGQDGLYDFGTEYENAVIELDVVVRADSIDNRIAKVAEIARLLNPKLGFQKMIFGDRPDVYYMVKVNNTMQQDLTKHKDLSYFTISLNAHPYAYKIGTSAVFVGNGTDGIEMLIETKTDADVPFRMEIGGNLEVKAPDFWDLKDDSKNVIPNPRFQLNSNGDAVKWNVSQEYNSEEDFYKEFGYVKEYPVYSDTQVDFINKIKNGIYLAEEFKIKITYAADTNGYLVRNYHYSINNYEVYTTTETVYSTDWTAQAEYTDSKIATDVNYVFKTLLANKIQTPNWTDYLVHQNLTDGTEYLIGKADASFFQTKEIEKKWKIVNNILKVNDLKSGNITIKEFGVRKHTTDTTIATDIVVNNVLVYRRFIKMTAINLANAPFEDFEYSINKWSTYYKGVLAHFGLTFVNGSDLLSKSMMIFTGNVYSVKGAYATTYNPLNVNVPLYEQYWAVQGNVIQSKDVTTLHAEDITSVIVRYMPYKIYSGIYSYVYVVFIKTSDGKITAVYQKNNINSVEPCITDVCVMYEIDKTALTSTDYPAIDTNGGHTDFADPVAWEYTVINKTIQGNPIQIEDIKVVTDMPTKSNDYFEPEHKLPVPAQNQNTITVSFTEQKLMQIPHNALTFNLAPYYSEFESRYRYVYSDVIGLNTLDKDFVLSAYLRDSGGRFGLIILDNNEVFKRVVLRTPQHYQDWSREYFTENLKAEDKKVIVFFEAVNTTHETDTLTMEFALPQLEIFPLSDFTENGTLYSLETRARKNLIDNAGFKFSNDGRMDRWGWTDNSAGMITKQYTAADLPKDLNGKSLGYGVVEVTCADNSTNTYSAYLSQAIQKVKPSTTYTLSAYLKQNGDTTTLKAKLTIVQKNANSAIIDAKTNELTLTTAWALYSHTVTTKAETTSIEIRIEIEKKGFALTSPAVIKIGAIQFEENSMATAWEDDNWKTEYLVATKNMVYNPAFGNIIGEALPDGWKRIVENPTGLMNTVININKTILNGAERNTVRFNLNAESLDDDTLFLQSKPIAVNTDRYYALSLYVRGKNIVSDVDLMPQNTIVKVQFLDTNNVVIEEHTTNAGIINSNENWGRYRLGGTSNFKAPSGAINCVVCLGVKSLRYVADSAYVEYGCVQLEEVGDWDSGMTSWEDNYTFTVKPPEQHSVIKPVYIRNPRIYRADGTLFFAWIGTILNTERITVDTEKFQAYVTKENGTKINILDDVFIYIYNRLDKQILSTDKMYLRYVDDSGLNENTQEPVAVSVKLDWTARTF